MNFESKLSSGEFLIPKCNKCKKIVWPPTEYCDYCFSTTYLEKGDFEGKIIEFSRQNDQYFCIVEFEDTIRIMANIVKTPKIGQTVKILKCGIKEKSYFFQVS